jgi:hypothetical protein
MPTPLEPDRLDAAFETYWPAFQLKLEGIPAAANPASPRSESSALQEVLQLTREIYRRNTNSPDFLAGRFPTFPGSQYPYLPSNNYNEMVNDICTYILRRVAPLEDRTEPYLPPASGRIGYDTVNDILNFIMDALPEQTTGSRDQ